MSLPIQLPDWLPWWVPALVLVPVLLYLLVFLLMPFSVFGLKGRLNAIEAQLDDLQDALRLLSVRLPDPARSGTRAAGLARDAAPLPYEPPPSRPAVPVPPPEEPEAEPPRRAAPPPRERSEPKLNWPR